MQQPETAADDERAQRQFANGLANVRNRNYSEALKDFKTVAEAHARSSVADNALIEIARHHLEVSGDFDEASRHVAVVQAQYPNSDGAPTAYILSGRIAMARSTAAAAFRQASADFDRARRIYPTSDQVPEALFYLGESFRLGGNAESAVSTYRELRRTFSGRIWSARSLLAEARAHVAARRTDLALRELQRVTLSFPGTPEALNAVEWSTIIYRLYLRPVPYELGKPPMLAKLGMLRDVTALALRPTGELVIAAPTQVITLDSAGAIERGRAFPGAGAIVVRRP